jgi:ABC-type glycerol-3-phosphate transport system substrate-binding protein
MRVVVFAVVAVAALAACGSTSSTPAAAPASTTAKAAGRPDEAHVAAGVAAFRKAFPDLAKGRTDKAIGHDVDAVCFDQAQGNPESVDTIGRRFENGGVRPDAAQAAAIAKAIQAAACPA